MRSTTWRAFMLFTLTLVLVFGAMDAQAARRSSLAGNQFINDADDMFAFPQLIAKYKNRVIFDLAPGNGDEGNGSIIFGDNTVWNFNTGRGDFLNNTANWAWGMGDRFSPIDMNGIPGNNGANGNGMEWWDLGMATNLGDTPFGFNISWATDKDKFTPAGGDPTFETSTNMLSFQLGATFGTVDVAGEVGFGSYTQDAPVITPQDMNDYSFFNFSLLARGDIEDVGGLNWRWIAAYTNGSTEAKMTDAVKLSTSALRASFGPVWGTPGEWEVAAYLNFVYAKQDEEGTTVDLKDTGSYTSFPGYNIAMEYYLNQWLVARGGVMSHNASDTFKEEVTGGGEDEFVERNYDFMWTLGLGVDKGAWGLDLALEEDDVHSGYLPLNGSVSSEPIAYMTAWLAW